MAPRKLDWDAELTEVLKVLSTSEAASEVAARTRVRQL